MPLAIGDLEALRAYIREDNPRAARDVSRRMRRAVEMLRDQPGLGRPGRVAGTRELMISATPYIIPYRVRGEVIELLRVYHGAGRWPEEL
jgi:toxin ParE1/3/4